MSGSISPPLDSTGALVWIEPMMQDLSVYDPTIYSDKQNVILRRVNIETRLHNALIGLTGVKHSLVQFVAQPSKSLT